MVLDVMEAVKVSGDSAPRAGLIMQSQNADVANTQSGTRADILLLWQVLGLEERQQVPGGPDHCATRIARE